MRDLLEEGEREMALSENDRIFVREITREVLEEALPKALAFHIATCPKNAEVDAIKARLDKWYNRAWGFGLALSILAGTSGGLAVWLMERIVNGG